MGDKDFWLYLEYRVCREIHGLRRTDFGGLWCDGFLPDPLQLTDTAAIVSGRVWMGWGSTKQELWKFSLLLPRSIRTEEDIDWATLLPADDLTGWLSLDKSRRFMKINPIAAYPDLQPHGMRPASEPRNS